MRLPTGIDQTCAKNKLRMKITLQENRKNQLQDAIEDQQTKKTNS